MPECCQEHSHSVRSDDRTLADFSVDSVPLSLHDASDIQHIRSRVTFDNAASRGIEGFRSVRLSALILRRMFASINLRVNSASMLGKR